MDLTLIPPRESTISGLSEDLRAGRVSCVEILERCLAQIDRHEPSIRAWVHVDVEGARKVAEERDAELKRRQDRGPLHGMPIGIKDIVDVAGWVTAAGSERWKKNPPAGRDAPIVAALRDAGAVIVGKTVTTQFASFDPPVTRNPWNLERTPGGSSSGSAAAVAAGMCLGAIGSQTGGSITRPAAFCGVAGCKPSYGRLSVEGIVPLAPRLDHPGPMARSVADLGLLLEGCVFDDMANRVPLRHLLYGSHAPPRIGRLRGLFEERATPEMRACLDHVVRDWSEAGAVVTEIELPPEFANVLSWHRIIMAVEAAAYHEQALAMHADDYGPAIRSLIEEGLASSATDYARACQLQYPTQRKTLELFERVDVLVCPAALGPAPELGTTGDPAFNSPWSYTGLPTVSFPIGLAEERMPLAAQLVGGFYREERLFEAALWCEQRTRGGGG